MYFLNTTLILMKNNHYDKRYKTMPIHGKRDKKES